MLIQAGAEDGSWLAWVLIGGAVVTSLLTLYAMMSVWSQGFLRDRADAPEGDVVLARPANLVARDETVASGDRDDVGRIPVGMFLSTALLVATSTAITFLAGPMSNITDRAAQSATDLSIYRGAVLGDDPSDPTRDLDAFREESGEGGTRDALDRRDNSSPAGPTFTGVTTEMVPEPVDAESNEVEK